MVEILIAAGSNLPDGENSPIENIKSSALSLEARGWRILARSRMYRNPAWPPGSGAPDYVNAAMVVEGAGCPEDLLAGLHEVERASGRRRQERYAARTLDLDLVGWGREILPDAATVRRRMDATRTARDAAPRELILPHPRMHERAFVLVPLADVAPDWRHPILGLTVRQLRDRLAPEASAELEPL